MPHTTELPPNNTQAVSNNTSSAANTMTFPQAVDFIRPQLDIVDVVGKHVALKKAGRNFSGLCPFHSEKTPSFSVSREKQLFKCFGCGEGGDSLGFLMKVEGKDFSQVIHDLADYYGVRIIRDGQSSEQYAKQKAEQDVFYDVMASAAKYYREQLLASQSTQNYLNNRQVSLTVQSQFGLGFAPPGWRHIEEALAKLGQAVTTQQLETLGLLIAKTETYSEQSNPAESNNTRFYDRFRNRLMVPIADDKGRVVAFGARALEAEDSPKYLNSPETPLYIKHQILYGLNVAKSAIRETGYALVMEGYFDVISSHQAGHPQAVGVCGTALSKEHLTLLRRAGAKIIYLCFDTDNAGQTAAFKTLENLTEVAFQQDLKFKVLQLPDGKDPDDYFKHAVTGDFEAELANAIDPWRFQFDRLLKQIPELNSIEGKVEAASALSSVLLRISQPVLKYEWVRQLSIELRISENSFLEELKRQESIKTQEQAAKRPVFESVALNNSQRKQGLFGQLSQQEAIYGLRDLYQKRSPKKGYSQNNLKNGSPPNPWPQVESITHLRQKLAGKTGLHHKEAELLNYLFLSKETWDYMTASLDTLKFSTPLAEQLLGHLCAIKSDFQEAAFQLNDRIQLLQQKIDSNNEKTGNRQEMLQYLADRVFEAEKLAETFLAPSSTQTEDKTEKLFRVIDTVMASVKLSKESVVLNTMFERLRDAEASGESSQLALQAELKAMLDKKRSDGGPRRTQ